MKAGRLFVIVITLGIGAMSPQVTRGQSPPAQSTQDLRIELAQCNLDRATLEHKLKKAEEQLAQAKDSESLRKRAEAAEKELLRVRQEFEAAQRRVTTLTEENAALKAEVKRLRPQVEPEPDPQAPAVKSAPVGSGWRQFEETTIDGTVEQIEQGTLFKTATGNFYEVTDLTLELVLELNPTVTVLTDGTSYKLIISGVKHPFVCEKLGRVDDPTAKVIESKIDGAFEGFSSGNVYKLRNGQIWEQTDARYRYRYRYAPSVIVWKDGAVFKMRVDGVDQTITVKRLK